MPLVSVVIPTFNRAGPVQRAISSVLNQTFEDYELLVVDDGSTDGTREVLAKFDGKARILFQNNAGVSAARNRGIERSSGELVAFLDSDDEWFPQKLEKQIALFDSAMPFFVCHTDEIWLRQGKEVSQKKIHKKQGGHFFERALARCLISPSSVLICRQLLDKVGWFDEHLPAAEDYDLWLRITAFHEVTFVPEPLVIKHGGLTDQLSRKTSSIDRFRIAAIWKILNDPCLPPCYRHAAVKELERKCAIVSTGLRKRGRAEEAKFYERLAEAKLLDTIRSPGCGSLRPDLLHSLFFRPWPFD